MMSCQNCEFLRGTIELLKERLREADERAAKATELMMRGEAARERLMLMAITGQLLPQDGGKA